MSELGFIAWAVLMLVGFAGSALFSGLETGVYSLNRIRLQILDHQRDLPARRLRRLLENPTTLLTTLLVGNNITNYLGTASLAVMIETGWGFGPWQTIVLNTLLATPILFVIGETLPKDLFAAHSDKLMYRLTGVLTTSRWIFTASGLVPLIGLFTGLLMKTLGNGGRVVPLHPKRQMEAMVKEGVGYGLLSDEQSAIVERVLDLVNRCVRDEMVPWSEVITVGVGDGPAALWGLARATDRSRFPVLDEEDRPVGVIDLTDALVHSPQTCPPIRHLMVPPQILEAGCPLREGLNRMQHRGAALAIVTEPGGEAVGVVTIKDLVEPITGELSNW